MTDAEDDEAADHLASEAIMLAQIDRLKAELRQYKTAMDSLEGYAIVPIEPTPAMLKAGQTAWLTDSLKRTTTLWKALVEAGRIK